jgi:hypothetical protein
MPGTIIIELVIKMGGFLLQTLLCVPTGSGVVELGSSDLVSVKSF